MDKATIGIIGGTGLGEILLEEAGGKEAAVETPFGSPSSTPIVANWEGVDVAFIARHGPGHLINPSNVPYRANVWAMKLLGVSGIIASGATGSLREDIEPGHLVLCDQVIDKTYRRESTFFVADMAVHTEFAAPFCQQLRSLLVKAASQVETTVHHAGTYVCMEGPQFSTRAESHMHRQWGGDLIGMTCMPEARLAREAEICYALVGLATDYDCWRPADPSRNEAGVLREVLANLQRASMSAVTLIREALRLMEGALPACPCQESLKLAIWSDKRQLDPAVCEKLKPLLGRYLSDCKAADADV